MSQALDVAQRTRICGLVGVALAAASLISTAKGQAVMSPRFEDYSVAKIYRGTVKPPNFGNRDRFEGTDVRCFGGDPSEYSSAHVNFAGHFVLRACTCGSGCHYLFMWDAVTGKFYQRVPPGVIDIGPYEAREAQPPGLVYKGEQYQPSSSLMIVEGCIEDTCDCATRYYRWTGTRFDLLLRQAVRMPERCLKKER